MEKLMTPLLKGTLAAMLFGGLLGGSMVSANEPVSGNSGLTPRKGLTPKSTVVRAQHPAPSAPMAKPPVLDAFAEQMQQPIEHPVLIEASPAQPIQSATSFVAAVPTQAIADTGTTDAFVYSELDRLAAEVAELKGGAKKTDTKKSWGAPKISGQLFLDTYAIDQDDRSFDEFGNVPNKAGIREMRLAVSGKGDGIGGRNGFQFGPQQLPNIAARIEPPARTLRPAAFAVDAIEVAQLRAHGQKIDPQRGAQPPRTNGPENHIAEKCSHKRNKGTKYVESRQFFVIFALTKSH